MEVVERMKKLSEINDSLPDLLVGEIVIGVLAELIGVWFVQDKLGYSLGLLIGVLIAIFCSWHMAYTINQAVNFDENTAIKSLQKNSAIRYGVMLIVLGILMITEIGNPLSAFIGMIGLKVSAYLAPFTHKIIRR